ncbi:ricin-type beta-trefoil lectin domain protein, partial [Kitasatospora sp. NPDC001664]
MGERLRAPRRTSGRRIAALAALAAVLAGGLAAPAYAADPAVRAGLVADDLNGDGRSDVWAADSSDLNVLPAGGAPYVASTAAQSPDGRTWNSFQVSGRGSATGGGTEDLYLFSPGTSTLYLYPNDADSGGRAGYFTKKDQAVKVAKPATCAAGADCTGYDPTWSSATQVVATDGIANKDGMPDLVTVEAGRLWYYPGKAGGAVIGAPVQLGGTGWLDTALLAPGKVGGVPTLWVRPRLGSESELFSYRLEFGADGLPAAKLQTPATAFRMASAQRAADGTSRCYTRGAKVGPCATDRSLWQLRADGTVRDRGNCLSVQAGAPVVAGCDGSSAQRWRLQAGGTLVAEDGRCLTAPADLAAPAAATLEACDGTPRQGWGRWQQDTDAPGPFPAPLDTFPLPVSGTDQSYGYLSALRSPGDLDGDGNPELVAAMGGSYTEGAVTVVRPGAAPEGGLPRFGEPVSLGKLDHPRNGFGEGGYKGRWDVYYSACVSLKVQSDGSAVVTELATGKVLWSSNTPGHPDGRLTIASGRVALRDTTGATPYWYGWHPTPGPTEGGQLTVQDDCNAVLRDTSGQVVWSTRTYDPAHETLGTPLVPGRTLKSGEQATADRTSLVMQADGNLVLTDRQSSRTLWSSGTEGHPGAVATLQEDGNLVVYAADGRAVWATDTWKNLRSRLVVQRDGNLVIYDLDGRVLWSTGTWYGGVETRGTVIPSGRTVRSGETVESQAGRLVMQADGNLVLYSKATGNARWSSRTWGNNGATAVMQADGNFVVRATDGRALWTSGTWTHRNARAVLQDDLNLVVYDQTGNARWATGTDNRVAARQGTALFAGAVVKSGEVVNTPTASPIWLQMQSDGNLVLHFNPVGAVWSSRTWGN